MSVVHARQATSLRVDQLLYTRLGSLAQAKGTSITRQLEQAIRNHLEAAVVENDMPIVHPALARIINDNLEASVTAKIDQMKERLASLLARNAIDSASVFLLQTSRMDEQEVGALRSLAAKHVRGNVAEFRSKEETAAEVDRLRRQVVELSADVKRLEAKTKAENTQREVEVARGDRQIGALEDAVRWYRRALKAIASEWDTQGILTRRKPFQAVLTEFEAKDARPREA